MRCLKLNIRELQKNKMKHEVDGNRQEKNKKQKKDVKTSLRNAGCFQFFKPS